ncbi:MAG: DUF6340 family protein [Bacteroidia bacterium]
MLPAHFQRIMLLDRTCPSNSKNGEVGNVVEGVLSGERPFQDCSGAESCLDGLRQELAASPRYTVTLAPIDSTLERTGTREIGKPLDWETVARLLNNDTAAALLVLEVFDSNTSMNTEETEIEERTPNGTVTRLPGFRITGRVNVYLVWRIYDLKNKTIVEEYKQESGKHFDSSGRTKQAAKAGLPSRDQMVMEAGASAGARYGRRIAPRWVLTSRLYYRNGCPELRNAARLVRYNSWKEAADIWHQQTFNVDPKIAGRACFNMALVAEKSGDIDLALQWLERAILLEDKIAPRYKALLLERKLEIQKANEQMKSKE